MFKKLRYVGIWVGGQIRLKQLLLESWHMFVALLFVLVVVVFGPDIFFLLDWTIQTYLLIIIITLTLFLGAFLFSIHNIRKEYPDWGKSCKEKIVLLKTYQDKDLNMFDRNLIKEVICFDANTSTKRAYDRLSLFISIQEQLKIVELYELAAYYSVDSSDRNKFIDHLTEGITYFKTDSNLFYMRAIAYSLADQKKEAYDDILSAIESYNLYPSNRKYDIFSQQNNFKYESALAEYKGKLNFNKNWGFSVGGEGIEYLKKLNREQMYFN